MCFRVGPVAQAQALATLGRSDLWMLIWNPATPPGHVLIFLLKLFSLPCNCFKDTLPNRHLCLNLYPCVIKVQSISFSVSPCLSPLPPTHPSLPLCVFEVIHMSKDPLPVQYYTALKQTCLLVKLSSNQTDLPLHGVTLIHLCVSINQCFILCLFTLRW